MYICIISYTLCKYIEAVPTKRKYACFQCLMEQLESMIIN